MPDALLVIDIQHDFTQPNGRMPVAADQAEQTITNINAMLEASEAKAVLPVYVGNEFGRFDPLNLFRNFASVKGTAGSRLDPRLRVVGNGYFSKRTGNAFSNPGLASFLREAGVEQLYLTGLYAEACVFETFKGARRLGFDCVVVKDAIATKTDERRRAMTERFSTLGAKLTTTAQWLERV
jgi:nicotinamidase-related amidase